MNLQIKLIVFSCFTTILFSCKPCGNDCEALLFASVINTLSEPYCKKDAKTDGFVHDCKLCANFKPFRINFDEWPTIKEILKKNFEKEFVVADSIGVDLSLQNLDIETNLVSIDSCGNGINDTFVAINISKGYIDTTNNKGIILFRVYEGENSGYDGVVAFEKRKNCWHILKYIDVSVY